MELVDDVSNEMADQIRIPPETPFDKKWELLRPVIQQLYVNESQKLIDVMAFLRERYNFVAQ